MEKKIHLLQFNSADQRLTRPRQAKKKPSTVRSAQIQIILRMRKVSYGPLLSILNSVISQDFLLADSGPDQTARAVLFGLSLFAYAQTRFRMTRPNDSPRGLASAQAVSESNGSGILPTTLQRWT